MEKNNEFNEEITNDDVELEQEITNDKDELVELTEEEIKEKSGGACASAPILRKFKLGRMYNLVGDVLKGNMAANQGVIQIHYGFGSPNIQMYYNNLKVAPRQLLYISDIYSAKIGFYDKGPTSGKSGGIVASTTLNVQVMKNALHDAPLKKYKVNINVYR